MRIHIPWRWLLACRGPAGRKKLVSSPKIRDHTVSFAVEARTYRHVVARGCRLARVKIKL